MIPNIVGPNHAIGAGSCVEMLIKNCRYFSQIMHTLILSDILFDSFDCVKLKNGIGMNCQKAILFMFDHI